jgi:hypothetical protein
MKTKVLIVSVLTVLFLLLFSLVAKAAWSATTLTHNPPLVTSLLVTNDKIVHFLLREVEQFSRAPALDKVVCEPVNNDEIVLVASQSNTVLYLSQVLGFRFDHSDPKVHYVDQFGKERENHLSAWRPGLRFCVLALYKFLPMRLTQPGPRPEQWWIPAEK